MIRTRELIVCAVVLALLLCSGAAWARLVTIKYDDSDPNSTESHPAAVGDAESVRFTCPSACEVRSVTLSFDGEAQDVEIHIWADDGTGAPEDSTELIPPFTITSNASPQWTQIDLADKDLTFEEPTEFHVGYVKLHELPQLRSDKTVDCALRSWRRLGGDWEYLETGDLLIRLTADLFNEPDEHTFEDVTDQAGISAGGRVAWCDLNNDGYDDVCSSGIKLFLNNTDGTFEDITESAGLTGVPASGCVCGDFDNDGHIDLFASLNSLTDYDRFIKNNGDGTFTDVTLELLEEDDLDYFPTEGAAWGDIDNDGFIDIYLANYEIIDPENPDDLGNCTQDKLYYNKGGERFVDAALQAGMDEGLYPMCGRGVNWGDYDNDGDLDIFVSNYRLDANYLWQNQGDGQFVDVAKKTGVQGTNQMGSFGHTIGSVWFDFDHDGDLDLLSANLAHPRFIEFSDISQLLINGGSPDYEFTDVILDTGIFYDETHSNPSVDDYDNDGYPDVYLTCVYKGKKSFLFRNEGDMTFANDTYDSGLEVDNGWGSAWGDYNNDGQPDMLAYSLFRNNGHPGNHWLRVRTVGTVSNASSIGTRVEVTVGTRTQIKVVSGGSGTTTQDSLVLHFGLGESETADEVRVRWLSGIEKTLTDVEADQTLTITETDEDDDDDDGDDDDDDDGCGCSM